MKTMQIKYVRALLRARHWANTEKGEKILCTIGATWGILAVGSFGLLMTGVLINVFQ